MLEGGVRPAGVIGTTFTVKAAAELKERVRERLIESGHLELAAAAAEALIGTVHSVCERLLKRFAFELGLSPKLDVISIEDGQRFFNQALDDVLDIEHVRAMNAITARLDLGSWQRVVKDVADKARENDLRPDVLAAMGRANADDFLAFFPAPIAGELRGRLVAAVDRALGDIDLTRDPTKGTAEYVQRLRGAQHRQAVFVESGIGFAIKSLPNKVAHDDHENRNRS